MKTIKKINTRRCVAMLVVAFACSCTFGAAGDTSPLNEVYTGLQLSDIERQMLSSISDGAPNSEEIGFYMMMGKVASLPQLKDGHIEELEAPGYKNLMRSPTRFRYQPLRMQVRIYAAAKLTVKNRKITAHSRYWPISKPMWEIHCTTANKTIREQYDEPLILYSTVIPDGLLEKGKKVEEDQWNFTNGPSFNFAGVFYKVVKKDDMATNTSRDYPVFLVWQISKAAVVVEHWSVYAIPAVLIVLGLLTGLILFVKLRGRIKREKNELQQGTIFKNYKPLRDSDDDINTEDEPVDPELTRAVEGYRKEHGIGDEQQG